MQQSEEPSPTSANGHDTGGNKANLNGSTTSTTTATADPSSSGGSKSTATNSNGQLLPITTRPTPSHIRERVSSVDRRDLMQRIDSDHADSLGRSGHSIGLASVPSMQGATSLGGGETGRDLSSAYASSSFDDDSGSSMEDDDDVMAGMDEAGRRQSLDEAERRRLQEAASAPLSSGASMSSGMSSGGSSGQYQHQQQLYPRSSPSSTSASTSSANPTSNGLRNFRPSYRRRDSYDTGNEAGRESSSGEESSDGESSYFSENLPSPKSTTPTAAAQAAAVAAAAAGARGKKHASGVPPAPAPQIPNLSIPYLTQQQQTPNAGTSVLDTSLSFSDDDDDGDDANNNNNNNNNSNTGAQGGGSGVQTAAGGGVPSQQRPHHNVPRVHRRSSSDEQLQLYTRTIERGTSAQSVSSIVSSSSDEAAGPEPTVHGGNNFGSGAPPSVSIPTIPRGTGMPGGSRSRSNSRNNNNPTAPRDPSEQEYNTDGPRYPHTSGTGTESGLDDSTVLSSSSPSSEFSSGAMSSTSSDPSVRSELREIGVPGDSSGRVGDGGRASGRRSPTRDLVQVTGTTPSSLAGGNVFFGQPSSSQQPPKIFSPSVGGKQVAATAEALPHPHAERVQPNQDQMHAWVTMGAGAGAATAASAATIAAVSGAGLLPSSSQNKSGSLSPPKRSQQRTSGSMASGATSEGHSHYFGTHESGSTSLNMMYSEDDDTSERTGGERDRGGNKSKKSRSSAGKGSVRIASEEKARDAYDGQSDKRSARFAEPGAEASSKSGMDEVGGAGMGDMVAGGFRVYWQRWLMLIYMSILNLLSDWTCYSVAPISVLTAEAFGAVDPESLVTIFLAANAVASACEPILLGRLGLRRTVVFGSFLLMLGSIIKSGGLPYIMTSKLEKGQGEWRVYVGFFLVGLSQPLYQCTPALLSASWFPEKERTMATGVALNSNQLGIGCAFVFGTLLVATSDDIVPYFELLSLIATLVFMGCALQFDDAPPTPPSDTARVIRGTLEVDIPSMGDFRNTISQSVRNISQSVRNLQPWTGVPSGDMPQIGIRRSVGSMQSMQSLGSSGRLDRSPVQARRGSGASADSYRSVSSDGAVRGSTRAAGSGIDAFRGRERSDSIDSARSGDSSRRRSRRQHLKPGSGSNGISLGASGNRARTSSEHSAGSIGSGGALVSSSRPRHAERHSSGGSRSSRGSRGSRRSASGSDVARRSSGNKSRSSSGRRSSRGGERGSSGPGSSSRRRHRTASGSRQSATAEYGFRTDPSASAPSPALADARSTRSAMEETAALEREAAEVGFFGLVPSPMVSGSVGEGSSGPDSGGGSGPDEQSRTIPSAPNNGTPPRPTRTRRVRSQPRDQFDTPSSRNYRGRDDDSGGDESYESNDMQPDSPFPHLQYDAPGMMPPQQYPPYGLAGVGGYYQTPDGQVYYGMPPPGLHPQMMRMQQPPPYYNPYQYGAMPYQQMPYGHYGAPYQEMPHSYPSLRATLPEVENPLDEGAEPVLVQTAHHLDINIRDDQIILSLRACFSRPGFIHCLASFTVSGIVINTLSTYMDYLVRLGGAGRQYVGIIGGLFQLLIMISSLIIGGFVDKTRAYYSVSMTMLVLGAFALAECGINLDEDRGNGLRWSLLVVGILVGPLQPVSTELGVDVVYPLSENTVLVIQQLFSNLLSALFIPFFKALKDWDLNHGEGENMPEKPQYTFSFYLLIILHAGVTFYFATFNGRYLRLEAELEKKRKKEEEEAMQAYMEGLPDQEGAVFAQGLAALGHNDVGSFEPVIFDPSYQHQQQQQQQYIPYYAAGDGNAPVPPPGAYGEQQPLMAGMHQGQHGGSGRAD